MMLFISAFSMICQEENTSDPHRAVLIHPASAAIYLSSHWHGLKPQRRSAVEPWKIRKFHRNPQLTEFWFWFYASGVSAHLFVGGLPHIQDLPSEWEDTVAVSPDDAQAGHGQRLGRVSLGEDQRAVRRVFPS